MLSAAELVTKVYSLSIFGGSRSTGGAVTRTNGERVQLQSDLVGRTPTAAVDFSRAKFSQFALLRGQVHRQGRS